MRPHRRRPPPPCLERQGAGIGASHVTVLGEPGHGSNWYRGCGSSARGARHARGARVAKGAGGAVDAGGAGDARGARGAEARGTRVDRGVYTMVGRSFWLARPAPPTAPFITGACAHPVWTPPLLSMSPTFSSKELCWQWPCSACGADCPPPPPPSVAWVCAGNSFPAAREREKENGTGVWGPTMAEPLRSMHHRRDSLQATELGPLYGS